MDLSQLGLLSGIKDKMDWLIQRQQVIASNIANVDTPGYEGKDITPFSFKSIFKKLQPTQTSAAHMQLASSAADGPNKEASLVRNAYEIKPDGNAVSSEAEMKKAADTAADYQLASNVYKKSVSLIEMALGEKQG